MQQVHSGVHAARTRSIILSEGDDDLNDASQDLSQQLQQRIEQLRIKDEDEEEQGTSVAGDATSEVGDATSSSSGGFRFERDVDDRKLDAFGDPNTVTGSRVQDERLGTLTVIAGRALTVTTLASLIFYIYVGLSGGITDGSDRFTEPVEDIRITMQREQMAQEEAEARAALEAQRRADEMFAKYGKL